MREEGGKRGLPHRLLVHYFIKCLKVGGKIDHLFCPSILRERSWTFDTVIGPKKQMSAMQAEEVKSNYWYIYMILGSCNKL